MPDNPQDLQGSTRTQAPSLGLGERLRSARKARALSVEQMAQALRLDEASVVALEEGRFAEVGAPVFVRGHLKRYALHVGMAPEVVLEAYRAAAPDSDAPPALARPRPQSDTVRIGPWAWWLAGAVILIGVVVALSSGGPGEPAPQITPPATAPVEVPVVAPAAEPPLATAPPSTEAQPQPPGAAAPIPVAPAAPAGN